MLAIHHLEAGWGVGGHGAVMNSTNIILIFLSDENNKFFSYCLKVGKGGAPLQ